jgi:Ca2+-binding RTX toxin-like protein
MLIGTAGAAGALMLGESASAATTATFSNGVLTVFGDGQANTITLSRDAAGKILVNNGAVAVSGGTPTVANTAMIQVFGQPGDDTIRLDESNGALPRANLFGGAGHDRLTGGSGGDLLFGQAGNDILDGRGGFDSLFGGIDNDTLTGGDANDQAYGESGDDTMVWNPGDDTDLNEGGAGIDTVQVNGGGGAETFTTTANGTRVRFDRLEPAPFAVDIGTSEKLVLNANGGDDSFSATGNLAALIAITVDGGTGADTLLGSNGSDILVGGDGDDFVDGQQGNDTALLGAGNDTFQWDPGDGSDVVEGQGDTDTMLFNGSNGDERFEASANGGRLRFTRNLGTIVMDTDDVEIVDLNVLGGTDTTIVNDLSGTDVVDVRADLAGVLGGTVGDGQADTVVVNGTNGGDTVDVFGSGTSASVIGLHTAVNVTLAEGANDSLVVNALGGNDQLTATTLPAGVIKPTLDGGAGDDRILGSQAADNLIGGDDADFVFGDNGNDTALLGSGDDEFQWDPGDGNDTIEGQDGADSMVFFGANVAENIDVVANGGRVLFLRNIATVTMDLDDVESIDFRALGGADNIVVGDLSGTDVTSLSSDLSGPNGGGDGAADTITVSGTQGPDVFGAAGGAGGVDVSGLHTAVNILSPEAANDRLVLNALAGDDTVNAASLQAGGIQLTENGGLGIDTLTGSGGSDLVNGGDGNDTVFMGDGDDTFIWNPGDDNDTLEGQAGFDTMQFNGANVAEQIGITANGSRVRFTRDIASVTMDVNDVEDIDFSALGGADRITVGDLSGTGATQVDLNLGAGDGAADQVIVQGSGGDDVALVSGSGGSAAVTNLAAQVNIAASANDGLTVMALGGSDVIEASALMPGTASLVEVGGEGDDILIGSPGDDVLDGGAGEDVLIGNGGNDAFLNGEIVIQGLLSDPGTGQLVADATTTATAEWVVNHVQIVDGRTVVTIDGRSFVLTGVDLAQLLAQATDLLAAAERPAAVGDFVWEDKDGDGLQDAGEPGIGGVAVRLIGADGQVVAKDATDGNGRYELVPTEPGEYTLEVVIPAGFQPTLVNVGRDDAVDSDVDPARVTVGESETTVRVGVETSGDVVEGTYDVGLVAMPTEPTTTTSTTTVPTTTVPTTTPVPTTAVPTTTTVPTSAPAPTTAVPTTPVPTTTVPTTTPPPATEVPTTPAPTTVAPAPEVPTTPAPTTPAPTTPAPTTTTPAG